MPTYDIKTLRSSGGDFTSISDWWENYVPNNVAASGVSYVLECYNDWPSGFTDSGLRTLSSRGASADVPVIIRAASGQGHEGVYGQGFKIVASESDANGVILAPAATVIKGITIENTNASAVASLSILSSSNGHLIESCFVVANSSSASLQVIRGVREGTVRNCVVFNKQAGIGTGLTNQSFYPVETENNVFYNLAKGIEMNGVGGNVTTTNNLYYNCTTDISYTSSGAQSARSRNNATSKSSAGGDAYCVLFDIDTDDVESPSTYDFQLTQLSRLRFAGVLTNNWSNNRGGIAGNTLTARPSIGPYYRPFSFSPGRIQLFQPSNKSILFSPGGDIDTEVVFDQYTIPYTDYDFTVLSAVDTVVSFDQYTVPYADYDFTVLSAVDTTVSFTQYTVGFEDFDFNTSSNSGVDFDQYTVTYVDYDFTISAATVVDFDQYTITYVDYDFSVSSNSGISFDQFTVPYVDYDFATSSNSGVSFDQFTVPYVDYDFSVSSNSGVSFDQFTVPYVDYDFTVFSSVDTAVSFDQFTVPYVDYDFTVQTTEDGQISFDLYVLPYSDYDFSVLSGVDYLVNFDQYSTPYVDYDFAVYSSVDTSVSFTQYTVPYVDYDFAVQSSVDTAVSFTQYTVPYVDYDFVASLGGVAEFEEYTVPYSDYDFAVLSAVDTSVSFTQHTVPYADYDFAVSSNIDSVVSFETFDITDSTYSFAVFSNQDTSAPFNVYTVPYVDYDFVVVSGQPVIFDLEDVVPADFDFTVLSAVDTAVSFDQYAIAYVDFDFSVYSAVDTSVSFDQYSFQVIDYDFLVEYQTEILFDQASVPIIDFDPELSIEVSFDRYELNVVDFDYETQQNYQVDIPEATGDLSTFAFTVSSAVDNGVIFNLVEFDLGDYEYDYNSNFQVDVDFVEMPVEAFPFSVRISNTVYFDSVKLFKTFACIEGLRNSDAFARKDVINTEISVNQQLVTPFVSVGNQTGMVQSDFSVVLVRNNALATEPFTITEVANGLYLFSFTPVNTGKYTVFIDTRVITYVEVFDRDTMTLLRNIEDEALGSWTHNKLTGELILFRSNGQELRRFHVTETPTNKSRTITG